MGLQVWLPLNKDTNVIPGISSFSKEGSVTFTEDTDGWYKVVDSSHTSSRWGIYYDFDVKPSTTYTLTVYSKSTTGISCSIGIGSFPGAVTWPAVRDTNNTSTEKLTTYTWTTTQNDTRARIYLAMTPGSTIADNYVFYKEPKVCEALTNQGLSSDVTITNNSMVYNSSGGKLGGYYTKQFTVSSPDIASVLNGDEFSVCFWIYINEVPTGSSVAETYVMAAGTSGTRTQFHIAIRQNGAGFAFCFYSDDYTFYNTVTDKTEKWMHVACLFQNNTQTVYVDGSLVGSRSTSGKLNIADGSPLIVYATHERLNDIRLYDHCLSQIEVKEISRGLVLHYPLDRNGWGQNNLLPGTDFNGSSKKFTLTSGSEGGFTYTPTETITPSTIYTISCYMRGNANMNLYKICTGGNEAVSWVNRDEFSTEEYRKFTITFSSPGSSKTLNQIYICTRYGSGNSQVGDWFEIKPYSLKMELGNTATTWNPAVSDTFAGIIGFNSDVEYDVSGYQNNGMRTGTFSWNTDSPKYSISQYFTGSSNYIRTASGTFNWFSFDKCTVSIWMKPTSTPSSYTGSFGIGHNSSDGYYSKCFSICNSGGKFTVNAAKGSTWIFVTSSYTCPLNEWHHYVATLDGTNLKMYVDGQQIHTTTIDWGTAYVASDTCIQVAVDLPGSDEMYQGYYSDARIYTTALSADDILELYNNKVI